MGNLGLNGRIILKWVLKNQIAEPNTGLIYSCIRFKDELL
jgi:hypothetical protein